MALFGMLQLITRSRLLKYMDSPFPFDYILRCASDDIARTPQMACAERAMMQDLLEWKVRLQDLYNVDQTARAGKPIEYAWGNDYLCLLNDLIADKFKAVSILQDEDLFVSLKRDEGIHAHCRMIALLCQQSVFLQYPLNALHAAEEAGVLVHQGRRYGLLASRNAYLCLLST
jgi:hypothetical protein